MTKIKYQEGLKTKLLFYYGTNEKIIRYLIGIKTH